MYETPDLGRDAPQCGELRRGGNGLVPVVLGHVSRELEGRAPEQAQLQVSNRPRGNDVFEAREIVDHRSIQVERRLPGDPAKPFVALHRVLASFPRERESDEVREVAGPADEFRPAP